MASSSSSSSSSSQNPNEWEVLSMSTMSASSLGLPSLREDEPVQKRDEQLPASETEALQFPTAHKDPPLQPQDLAQEDIDVPLDEEALLNVEVSDRVPYKNSKVSWWRRPSMLLKLKGTHSKSNAVCSIALVAAFFGIVVVGYRLQRERSHNQQLKLDLYAKEEKLNDLTYQVNRLKEAMTGRRRVGLTRNSFF